MEFHGFTTGLAIICGGIVAAIALVALVRKMFSKDTLRQAHDITGNLLSVVGTLYAVLLGLIVVDALVRFEHAIDVVQQESNALADIFLLANRLPKPERGRLQETCKTYARQVVGDEWPLMATGHASMAARKTAFDLARCLDPGGSPGVTRSTPRACGSPSCGRPRRMRQSKPSTACLRGVSESGGLAAAVMRRVRQRSQAVDVDRGEAILAFARLRTESHATTRRSMDWLSGVRRQLNQIAKPMKLPRNTRCSRRQVSKEEHSPLST